MYFIFIWFPQQSAIRLSNSRWLLYITVDVAMSIISFVCTSEESLLSSLKSRWAANQILRFEPVTILVLQQLIASLSGG